MEIKEFKDKELKYIVNKEYNDECQDYLYKQLAEYGENVVWALLLADYLSFYKWSPTEEHKSSVEALVSLMPDDSRQKIVRNIKHDYLSQYFDKSLIIWILTYDFPSRLALENKEKADWGAGL